jgi:hypothetical protein
MRRKYIVRFGYDRFTRIYTKVTRGWAEEANIQIITSKEQEKECAMQTTAGTAWKLYLYR